EPKQQPMKRAEGKPRLGLRSRRRHHRRPLLARPLHGGLQQRGLADPRLPANDERTATAQELIDHPVEALHLRIAPQEQPVESYNLRIDTSSTHARRALATRRGTDSLCTRRRLCVSSQPAAFDAMFLEDTRPATPAQGW